MLLQNFLWKSFQIFATKFSSPKLGESSFTAEMKKDFRSILTISPINMRKKCRFEKYCQVASFSFRQRFFDCFSGSRDVTNFLQLFSLDKCTRWGSWGFWGFSNWFVILRGSRACFIPCSRLTRSTGFTIEFYLFSLLWSITSVSYHDAKRQNVKLFAENITLDSLKRSPSLTMM